MIDLNDIHSLTDFKRNTNGFVKQMQDTKNPLVLTVNGKASLVVQDAQSYQEMLERIERAETVAAVRRSMEEYERGEGRPAEQGFEELRNKHGIPR